jgi:hypothetical protein
MDCGGPSVFISIVTQRIAGYSANKVVDVFRSLSKQTALLHAGGLVHCDIKVGGVHSVLFRLFIHIHVLILLVLSLF